MVNPAEVKTATQRIFLRPDGIVQTTNLVQRELTLADARENVRAVRSVSGGVRRPLLVDASLPGPVSKEAQELFTSAETAAHISALGIVVTSWVGEMIGNFVISRQSRAVSMKLFHKEAEAIAWLRTFLPR